jgi:glycosyltransferase involved in cell wall biosynthesis
MKSFPLLQESFDRHKIAVLIPTYNNEGTLGSVIEGVLKYTGNLIVVNDGSTDSTGSILNGFTSALKENHLVQYPNNRGKGHALRLGFRQAVSLGYDYVISIDSDGQHFPDDLHVFIEKLEEKGPCLIIGSRNMNQSSVPGKSSFGHKFSNFWFWVETGIKAPDTQSGYRLYPVKMLNGVRYFSKKFEFEIEVIVRAAWKGIAIESVPVKVYYAPKGERVSHFRPFRDFTRISILNTLLVLITFLYINPINFVRAMFRKSTYSNLRKEVFNPHEPVPLTSVSVAFGVFMGIVPMWGFQLLTAIALSVLLRLNKGLVILSANISIPPMIPLIIFLSYKMGEFWVGSDAVAFSLSNEITLEAIHNNFMQYVYGAVTLALVAGTMAGILTYAILKIKKQKQIPGSL